jgi:hypothetical protein
MKKIFVLAVLMALFLSILAGCAETKDEGAISSQTTTTVITTTTTTAPPKIKLNASILEIENTGERANIHNFLFEMYEFLLTGSDDDLVLELIENISTDTDSSDIYSKWFSYKGGIKGIGIIFSATNNFLVTNIGLAVHGDAPVELNDAIERLFLAALYAAAINKDQVSKDLEHMFDAGGYTSTNGYKIEAELLPDGGSYFSIQIK